MLLGTCSKVVSVGGDIAVTSQNAHFLCVLQQTFTRSKAGEGWPLLEQILLVVGNIYSNINTFKQSFTLLSIYLWCCNNIYTAATCYVIVVSFTVTRLWYVILLGKLKVIAKTRPASAVEWFFLRVRENVRMRWVLWVFKQEETIAAHIPHWSMQPVASSQVCIDINFYRNIYSH